MDMNRIYRILAISLTLLMMAVGAFAQSAVQGRVVDSNGEAVPGAVVMLKGSTTVAAVSAEDGSYAITIPASEKNPVLEASCLGFSTVAVPVEKRSKLDFILEIEGVELDESVVVGYGAMRKSDLTGAVTSVDIMESEAQRSTTIDNLLKGHAAGVQVLSDNASPDAGVNIRIRGLSTFNGSSEPLYVVDGIILNSVSNNESLLNVGSDNEGTDEAVNGLMGLNPQDIASIEILKDASATAIYGALGANGVILITTKSAKKDKPTVNFTAGVDVSNRYRKLPVLNFDEYVDYLELQQAAGINTSTLLNKIYENPATREGLKVTPMDWQDYVFRTAIGQRYYFSIAGRPKSVSYAFSIGYNQKEGIVKNTGLKQLTVRLNLDKRFTPKLRLSTKVNIGYVFSNQTQSGGKALSTTSLIRSILTYRPYSTQVEDDEDPDPESELSSHSGPDKWLQDFVNTRKEFRVTPSVEAEYKILPNLTFKSTLGGDYRDNLRVKFKSSRINSTAEGSAGAVGSYRYMNWNWDNVLSYKNKFTGGHNLTALLGVSANSSYTQQDIVQGWNILQYRALEKAVKTAPNTTVGYVEGHSSTLSFFTRIIYNFKDRYVLTATCRADGSSKFQGKNKWSVFPSAAFAWRINEEPWFNSLLISQFKLRVGWGQVGNQRIADYQTLSNYKNVSYADHTPGNSSEASIGLAPENIANPNLKWETTQQTNLGIDFGMWQGRLAMTVDAYDKLTFDLLQDRKIATSSGFSSMWMNDGSIRNQGIEITVNAVPVKAGDFEWTIGGNISFNRSRIRSMNKTATSGSIYYAPGDKRDVVYFLGESAGSSLYGNEAATIFMEGYPMGLFYGYATNGIIQEGGSGPALAEGGAPAGPGQLNIVDCNGNGYIDPDDRCIIGNPNPDFTFGLSTSLYYKGFTLSITANGSYGNDILNINNMRETDTQSTNHNVLREAVYNAWTPENTGAKYWGIGKISSTETRAIKDMDIEDGSYLRLANVSLSYDIPLPKKSTVLKGLNVGLSGGNLYILTKYSGWDPEVNSFGKNIMKMGTDAGSYPSARSYSFDIKFTF